MLYNFSKTLLASWLLIKIARWYNKSLESELMDAELAHPGIGYYIFIWLWAQYTNVSLEDIRNTRSYELVALLGRYTILIDNFVDSSAGNAIVKKNPYYLKQNHQFSRCVSALVLQIERMDLNKSKKTQIVRRIQNYRRSAFTIVKWMSSEPIYVDYAATLRMKEATTGKIFELMTQCLNIIHDVPETISSEISTLISRWGMAMQVIDDLYDAQDDFGVVPNIVTAVMYNLYPEEADQFGRDLSKQAGGYAKARLVRCRAPQTELHIHTLISSYLTELKYLKTHNPNVVCNMVLLTNALLVSAYSEILIRFHLACIPVLLKMIGSKHVFRNLEFA